MAKRYDQMLPLIDKVRPRLIVEVGVHRAMRALRLCTAAMSERENVHYIGYDVFDTLGPEFQVAALNGKGMSTESKARERLNSLVLSRPDFSYEFIVGDTRDTLHGQSVTADFAFIDGDHRVDAIRGDYAALQSSQCVVFDDYYRPGKDGALPDLTLYGANSVVDELAAQGRKVKILPAGDGCKHGGLSHLAVVWL